MRDLYADLGVSPSASTEEIRCAYLRIAAAEHPDRTAGRRARGERIRRDAFLNAVLAYRVLRSAERRSGYDLGRAPSAATNSPNSPSAPSRRPAPPPSPTTPSEPAVAAPGCSQNSRTGVPNSARTSTCPAPPPVRKSGIPSFAAFCLGAALINLRHVFGDQQIYWPAIMCSVATAFFWVNRIDTSDDLRRWLDRRLLPPHVYERLWRDQ